MKSIPWKKNLIFSLEIILVLAYIAGTIYLIFRINEQFIYLSISVLYVINILTGIILFTQKRQNASKLSWFILILILPLLGNLFFFMFGLSYTNKNELELHKDKRFHISNYPELTEKLPLSKTKINHLKYLEFLNKNDSSVANIKLYAEGYDYYKGVFESLNNAKNSIKIVTYVIKPSEIATEFINILEKKAEEGLEITWLIDYFGSAWMSKKAFKKLESFSNVSVEYIGKIYYPFIRSSNFYRNHQKFIIVDDNCVFSGGNNISSEYDSMSKKYGHWIDLNYRISGPYINQYILHFAFFWKVITDKDISVRESLKNNMESFENEYENYALLVTDSPALPYSEAESYWLKIFASAKRKIKISTPYFSISNSLIKQIIIAIKSGVEVEIYYPGISDNFLAYAIGLEELKWLSQHGAKIYTFKNHFLHTKMGLVDGEIAWFGSSNFDSRSMYAQYETMDLVSGKVVLEIKKLFNEYKQKSILMTEIELYTKKISKIRKLFFKLLKPLI